MNNVSKTFLDWRDIPYHYHGNTIVFFFEEEAVFLEFLRQEIQSGGLSQFAVVYGKCQVSSVDDESIFCKQKHWQLSTTSRNYLEKQYA